MPAGRTLLIRFIPVKCKRSKSAKGRQVWQRGDAIACKVGLPKVAAVSFEDFKVEDLLAA
eukprot:1152040-Pelagomonas_calceolata.AAC.2